MSDDKRWAPDLADIVREVCDRTGFPQDRERPRCEVEQMLGLVADLRREADRLAETAYRWRCPCARCRWLRGEDA